MILRVELADESDKRLALLGESRGLFWATAKGARKSRRRFVGVLEPFTRGEFHLSRYGRTSYVDAVDVTGRRDRIPGDLGRYYVACYLCELTGRLLRADSPAPGYFDLVRRFLDDIQASEGSAHLLWRLLFEAELLELQGLMPVPDPGLAGAGTLAFDLVTGEVSGGGNGPGAGADDDGRVAVDGRLWELFTRLRDLPLPEARRFAPPPEVLRPLNRLTARMVRDHLQLPLRSSRLLNDYQRRALEAAEAGAPGSP